MPTCTVFLVYFCTVECKHRFPIRCERLRFHKGGSQTRFSKDISGLFNSNGLGTAGFCVDAVRARKCSILAEPSAERRPEARRPRLVLQGFIWYLPLIRGLLITRVRTTKHMV